MSQAELADAVGTTRSQINRLERGVRRLSLEWMSRIARVFEVELFELAPPGGIETAETPEQRILGIVAQLPEKDKLMLVAIARDVLRYGSRDAEPDSAGDRKRRDRDQLKQQRKNS